MLHCYLKENGKSFTSSPENIFLKKLLYAKHDASGARRDVSKERELATQVESPADSIVRKIVSRARRRQRPKLTAAEKHMWDVFFCAQMRRTLSARADLPDAELVRDAMENFELRVGPLTTTERREFDGSPEKQRDSVNNAWIDIITVPMGDLFNTVQQKGVLVFRLDNPKKSFIVGSVPVLPMIPVGATLEHREATTLFPVARDIAVACYGRCGHEDVWSLPKDSEGTALLRKINAAIFRQSSMVASPSRELIDSLRRNRE